MKRKLLSVILATTLLATMLTGCKTGTTAPTNTDTFATKAADNASTDTTDNGAADSKDDPLAKKGGLVYLVSKGFQHQYWQAVYQGAQKAAEEFDVELKMEGPATESDIADQVQMLNNAVNQKPIAIGLAALDTEACLDGITAAMNANIPIIGFDSGVSNAPEGAVYANASTDNYQAGVLAAQETFKLIQGKLVKGAKIGVLSQDATAESIINRGQGFIDEMKAEVEAAGFTVSVEGHAKFEKVVAGADIVIQVAVPASVTTELSVIDAQNMLNNSAFICIYGSNQHSAEALVTADQNLGKLGADKVIGVGFDAGTVIKAAVANKVLAGAVTQDPMNIGYMTVKLAVAAANGETVESVDTGCQWYTSENMNDDNIAPNLYD
ncbi:MAG TPA: substrate-binding domain-containing protein [Clostridiales bacterium]|nr:substrate-binding domain-containing protein [Clostridiales bacterium]